MQPESLSFKGGFFKATGVAMVALLLSGLWGSFGPQLLTNANRMEKKKVASGSLVDSATAQKEEEVAKLQEVVDASGMTQSPSESSDFAPNGEPINTPGTSGMTEVGSELRVTAMSATGGAHTFGAQGSLLHTNSSGMLKDAALADTSKDQKQTPGLLKDAALADTSKDQKQTPGLLKDAALADTSKEAEPEGDGADFDCDSDHLMDVKCLSLSDDEFFKKVIDKVFKFIKDSLTKKYEEGKLAEKLKKLEAWRMREGEVESVFYRRKDLDKVCTMRGISLDTIIAEVKEEDKAVEDLCMRKALGSAPLLRKAKQELCQKIIQSCPKIKMEFVKSSSNDKIELSQVRELISALVGDQVRQGVDTESKGKDSKKTMDDWFEELPSEERFYNEEEEGEEEEEDIEKYGEGPFDYAEFLDIFTSFLWDFQLALKDGEPYASYLLPFKDGVKGIPYREPSASGWEYLKDCPSQ